jgi:NADH-quinone oxidoreductase subunit J
MVGALLFWLMAGVAIFGALSVVLQRHPMRSAMFLVLTMLALAVLFLQLHAYLAAMLQVMVYAGAVMVLFVFVIMLLGLEETRERFRSFYLGMAFTLGALLITALWYGFLRGFPADFQREGRISFPDAAMTPAPDQMATTRGMASVARALFTGHVFALELTALLLVVAMVGVAVMAHGRLRGEGGEGAGKDASDA